MTVREIRGHLEEHYGVAVSSDLMSRVTDAVLGEVREWQNRPLAPVYPVVLFDALRVRIEGLVRNKLSRRHRHGVPAHRRPEYTLTPPPSCPTSQDHLNPLPDLGPIHHSFWNAKGLYS